MFYALSFSLQSHARQLSELQEDLKASRSERERLEQSLDAVRKDLRLAQNSDVAYAQMYHENERLKHEVKRLKKDSSIDPDSERAYFDREFSNHDSMCMYECMDNYVRLALVGMYSCEGKVSLCPNSVMCLCPLAVSY